MLHSAPFPSPGRQGKPSLEFLPDELGNSMAFHMSGRGSIGYPPVKHGKEKSTIYRWDFPVETGDSVGNFMAQSPSDLDPVPQTELAYRGKIPMKMDG